MTIEMDETMQMYMEESQEHLADIENDLLAIEESGADIDEDLVNKVFRAAHSIKGGAGFMGLTNIKELSHKMENVLGMIRSREMVPNPEIVNILLLASDALRNLISNVTTSNDIDVTEHIEALISLAEGSLPDESKESISKMLDISFPGGKTVFSVAEYDISNAREGGKFIYLVDCDLIHDVHNKGKNPLEVLKDVEKSGIILESKVDIEGVGSLEGGELSNRLPFLILFATILDPTVVNALFEIEGDHIYELGEDLTTRLIDQASPQEEVVHKEAEVEAVEKAGARIEPETEAEMPEEDELQRAAEEISPKEAEIKPIEQTVGTASTGQRADPSKAGPTVTDTSLRVHVSLLDSLMNLAGELVLGRNQLLQAIESKDFRTIQLGGQRLDLITSELQEAIMLTRMQPIGNVFSKFQRVVRDLARNLGKQVELVIDGSEVELDKTIIEAISDPLTHLVRNSADHGIDIPDERLKAGKEATGTIHLKAFHEAGQVNIEIIDDGKGLDGNMLAATAMAKGLITEDQARTMSDKEKVNLIFLPGFSTAKEVTDVSGRGVGMDVVKTNLDKLGGVVDIESELGKGTRVRIKLPLTLAIIPSQIITTGGDHYAIPQVNMDELLRIPAGQIKERIEKVGDAAVVRLRGQLLPLISLNDVLGIEQTYIDPEAGEKKPERRERIADRRSKESPIEAESSKPEAEGSRLKAEGRQLTTENDRREKRDRRFHADSAVNIVVVTTGALKYGLVVDKLHDSEEIVVKPLGRHFKRCKGYAGATIMGDGRVALILDVGNLAHMAGLTSLEGTDRAAEVAKETAEAVTAKKDMQSLLVFRSAEDEQFAVTLSQVERIEKVKAKDVEEVGGKRVMKYRGGSLPLISIDQVAQVKPLAEKEDLLVIVVVIAGKEIGLLAIGPVDAMDVTIEVDGATLKQPGIMGSAVIGEHTTQMIDMYGLVEALNPDWFTEQDAVQTSDGGALTVLIAEDSNFFRNQVKGFIEDSGYNVIDAEDGIVAWDLLEEHADEISLVVTDIEMPNMNGFELTKKIKGDERFSHLQVIALTTLAGKGDIAKGKEVGIDDYQIKLDRENLMESIQNRLSH
ncbi:MAG: chemotaxis protein CheW [Deltaproteobacteria bacterium]|nr:chemotaxis protein CheW [Deltaproteobacteria bacterium]